jgi:HSP20 family protein
MSVTRFDPFGDSFRYSPRANLALDVWQSADGYHVAMDVPGIDPDDVKITIERDILTIGVERQPEYRQDENVIVAERPEGCFTRQLQLSGDLDLDHVLQTCSCDEGVLHLTIPLAKV